MEKIVVVSTNNNPDYYFYSPYIKKAWNHWGWKVAVMFTEDTPIEKLEGDYLIQLPKIEELRSETIAQAGRLYAANHLPLSALIMTSDMDLLPLSDYWKPEYDKITVFGHDLTDYTYFPMGYTAMTGFKWRDIFGLTYNTKEDLLRGAHETGLPFKEDWEQWWNHDWKLLTMKLKDKEVTHIKRGRRTDSPFAFGRIDRGDSMKIIPEPWVDAHCENFNVQHPDKKGRFLEIFEKVYGKLI